MVDDRHHAAGWRSDLEPMVRASDRFADGENGEKAAGGKVSSIEARIRVRSTPECRTCFLLSSQPADSIAWTRRHRRLCADVHAAQDPKHDLHSGRGGSGECRRLWGWTSAANEISLGAWALFALLFLWQFPHFLAIAWLYREQYERAGIKMLPVVDRSGVITARQILPSVFLHCRSALLRSFFGHAVSSTLGQHFLQASGFLSNLFGCRGRRTIKRLDGFFLFPYFTCR